MFLLRVTKEVVSIKNPPKRPDKTYKNGPLIGCNKVATFSRTWISYAYSNFLVNVMLNQNNKVNNLIETFTDWHFNFDIQILTFIYWHSLCDKFKPFYFKKRNIIIHKIALALTNHHSNEISDLIRFNTISEN